MDSDDDEEPTKLNKKLMPYHKRSDIGPKRFEECKRDMANLLVDVYGNNMDPVIKKGDIEDEEWEDKTMKGLTKLEKITLCRELLETRTELRRYFNADGIVIGKRTYSYISSIIKFLEDIVDNVVLYYTFKSPTLLDVVLGLKYPYFSIIFSIEICSTKSKSWQITSKNIIYTKSLVQKETIDNIDALLRKNSVSLHLKSYVFVISDKLEPSFTI